MTRAPIRAQKPANIPILALVRSFPVSICFTLPKGSTYNDSSWLDIRGVRRLSVGVTGTLPDVNILGVGEPDVRSLGVELAGVELCIPDPPVTMGVSILTFFPFIKNFIRLGELEIIWANLLVVHSVSNRKRFLTLGKNNLREKMIGSCALFTVNERRFGASLESGLIHCVLVGIGKSESGSSRSSSIFNIGWPWLPGSRKERITWEAMMRSR